MNYVAILVFFDFQRMRVFPWPDFATITADCDDYYGGQNMGLVVSRMRKKKNKKSNGSAMPKWNRELRELRAGVLVVKRFKVPARNQELILDSFEEEGWPTCIDDPLPPLPDQDSKQRLHDTIDRLNRSQVNRMIRFRGNGNGCGVRWEWIGDRSPTKRR